MAPSVTPTDTRILVVDDDGVTRHLVTRALLKAGYAAVSVENGLAALDAIEAEAPHLVVSDVDMPGLGGFDLVMRLRADPATAGLPVIFMSGSAMESPDVVKGLSLGADDYVRKPVDLPALLGLVERRLADDQAPRGLLGSPRGGLLSPTAFRVEADAQVARSQSAGGAGVLALTEIVDHDRLVAKFGPRLLGELLEELAALAAGTATDVGLVGRDEAGRLLLVIPDVEPGVAVARLEGLVSEVGRRLFVARGERLHLTPAMGVVAFGDPDVHLPDLLDRARTAAAVAHETMDLRPVLWTPDLVEPSAPAAAFLPARSRTPLQFVATLVLGILLPFLAYVVADRFGVPLARVSYLVVVGALLLTGVSIWAEGILALRPIPMPTEPSEPFPVASAIIAAYLPNEAATVEDTLEAFLRVDYPAELQVILAYNTPRPLPIEARLRELARREPRLELLKVEGSTSKAQNVNSALAEVRGEFVGVFDADHHPARDAFRRAWHWLCDDFDVVQGHCVVRNGDASWVARTVAVEFESIYAVSHPGRARLHAFGIFGGSNGYWRTGLLRETRMRGSMLTEDIDSSLRVVSAGGRIASDPHLYSRELAPTTVTALWNQRMRWAQGWFQVSLRHLWQGMRSSRLSVRQKLGYAMLLGWREAYPWIALQMIPIIAFLCLQARGAQNLDWAVPIFVVTTIFMLSVGPGQTLFAWKLGAPEIRAHGRWFLGYLVVASLLYTEFKNVINRVAQVKEFSRDSEWRVTPRSAEEPAAASSGAGG